MSNLKTLYEYDDLECRQVVETPAWCRDIRPWHVAGVLDGGCASGSYMPAVTYHEALAALAEYGGEVYDFLDEHNPDWRDGIDHSAWCLVATSIMSMAVEAWCSSIYDELLTKLEEEGAA